MIRRLAILLFLALQALPALAVNPDEILADPALEQRARNLSAQLRCMVCQNQSIDDSNAELARDLRVLVRERITGGDSDQQVIDYIVSRYGEFVLLKPRFSVRTLMLWGAPFILVLAGVAIVVVSMRNLKTGEPVERLSEEEEARIRQLLEKKDGA